jgi:hypothetical protein
MNRRQLVMLSGAAMVAGQGLAQASPVTAGAGRRAAKVLLKLQRTKSSYRTAKSETKQAKHLRSLASALSLTSDQQQQAADVFGKAVAANGALRANLKAARKNLSQAVKNNDAAGIREWSGAIGNLKAQITFAGTNANAAFLSLLTPNQTATLDQFRS